MDYTEKCWHMRTICFLLLVLVLVAAAAPAVATAEIIVIFGQEELLMTCLCSGKMGKAEGK